VQGSVGKLRTRDCVSMFYQSVFGYFPAISFPLHTGPACTSSPLQGFCGPSGARFMDYMVCDNVSVPMEYSQHYTEKLVHVPDTYFVNDYAQASQVELQWWSGVGWMA